MGQPIPPNLSHYYESFGFRTPYGPYLTYAGRRPPPAQPSPSEVPSIKVLGIRQLYRMITEESDGAASAASTRWSRLGEYLDDMILALAGRGVELDRGWPRSKNASAQAFFEKTGATLDSMREWSTLAKRNATALSSLASAIVIARAEIKDLYKEYIRRLEAIKWAYLNDTLAPGAREPAKDFRTRRRRNDWDYYRTREWAEEHYNIRARHIAATLESAYAAAEGKLVSGAVFRGPKAVANPLSALIGELKGLGGAGGGGLGGLGGAAALVATGRSPVPRALPRLPTGLPSLPAARPAPPLPTLPPLPTMPPLPTLPVYRPPSLPLPSQPGLRLPSLPRVDPLPGSPLGRSPLGLPSTPVAGVGNGAGGLAPPPGSGAGLPPRPALPGLPGRPPQLGRPGSPPASPGLSRRPAADGGSGAPMLDAVDEYLGVPSAPTARLTGRFAPPPDSSPAAPPPNLPGRAGTGPRPVEPTLDGRRSRRAAGPPAGPLLDAETLAPPLLPLADLTGRVGATAAALPDALRAAGAAGPDTAPAGVDASLLGARGVAATAADDRGRGVAAAAVSDPASDEVWSVEAPRAVIEAPVQRRVDAVGRVIDG